MEQAVIEGETPGVHRLWRWHNVVIIAWHHKASVEAVEHLAHINEAILARAEYSKLSFIHLVRNQIELPDAAVRTAFVETSKRFEGRQACAAVIIGGGGFWASAIRGFVTSVHVLSRQLIQLRVHAS